MPTKKADKETTTTNSGSDQKPPYKRPVSLPKGGKDPKGGLTAEGRKRFNETTGGHLQPGVKGKADTPEKMKRKGSFLARHFTHPQGPVEKDGEPTRQALQAAAWGEPVPKTEADEKKLAAKGRDLLKQYHEAKDKQAPNAKKKTAEHPIHKTATEKAAPKKT